MNTGSIPTCDRTADIEFLRNKVLSSPCSVVVGIAGMGKSRLADSLREYLASDGRKIIFFHCLFGWDDQDFYTELFNLLDHSYSKKDLRSTRGGPEQLCVFLEEKELTLFIDDFQFVECRGTLALFAHAALMKKAHIVFFSRKKPELDALIFPDVFLYVLKGLAENETAVMVESIFRFQGMKPPASGAIRIIHDLAGGHPFSVKIICGLLMTGKLSLNELEKRENVDAHLEKYLSDLLWHSQSDDVKAVMKVLSAFRAPVTREVVTMLAGENAPLILDRLWQSCLVEFDPSGRLSLHDLLRRFILRQEGKEKARCLHLEAAELLHHNFYHDIEALREAYFHYNSASERERAVDALIDLAEINLYLQDISKDIAHLLQKELATGDYRMPDLRSAIASHLILLGSYEEAEKALSHVDNPDRLFLTAMLHDSRGNGAQALDMFQKCLSVCRDEKKRMFVQLKIAISYIYLGNMETARICFEKITEWPDLEKYPIIKASCEMYYSSYCYMNCMMDRALTLVDGALEGFRSIGASNWISNTLYRKGMVLLMMKRFPEARVCAEEALCIAQDTGDTYRERTCYSLLGEILFKSGSYRESIDTYHKGLELNRRMGLKYGQALNMSMIGVAYLHMEDLKSSEKFLSGALEFLGDFEDMVFKVQIMCNFIEFLLVSGSVEQAYTRLQELEHMIKGTECPVMATYDLHLLWEKTCRLLGKAEEAAEQRAVLNHLLEDMSPDTRKMFEDESCWLEEKTAELAQKLLVFRHGSDKEIISRDKLSDLLNRTGNFDIVADFAGKNLTVDGHEIDFFNKRAMVKLFWEFVSIPGEVRRASDVYPKVWERKYDPEADANTFRMNISRLRKILDQKRPDRFIAGTDEGGYTFNTDTNYCIIMKIGR
ncbi:MAG: winged helix-turn-helix domain-containing protein [Candidatus Wallbacteria bacterium]|nr:winged helix-turn-helix domain-containing protein [Candidatus Wallbacteria bacterium]